MLLRLHGQWACARKCKPAHSCARAAEKMDGAQCTWLAFLHVPACPAVRDLPQHLHAALTACSHSLLTHVTAAAL